MLAYEIISPTKWHVHAHLDSYIASPVNIKVIQKAKETKKIILQKHTNRKTFKITTPFITDCNSKDQKRHFHHNHYSGESYSITWKKGYKVRISQLNSQNCQTQLSFPSPLATVSTVEKTCEAFGVISVGPYQNIKTVRPGNCLVKVFIHTDQSYDNSRQQVIKYKISQRDLNFEQEEEQDLNLEEERQEDTKIKVVVGWKFLPTVNKIHHKEKEIEKEEEYPVGLRSPTGTYNLGLSERIESTISAETHYKSLSERYSESSSENFSSNFNKLEKKEYFGESEFKESQLVKSSSSTVFSKSSTKIFSEHSSYSSKSYFDSEDDF